MHPYRSKTRHSREVVHGVLAGFAWFYFVAGASGGTVVTWGEFNPNVTNTPLNLTNVVAVASGSQSMIALTSDGNVMAWGECCTQPRPNQIDSLPALSNIVAIASGAYHALALFRDGTVFGWGNNQFGQATVPPVLTNVSAIASGAFHCLALTSNGIVVAWGRNAYGEAIVPSGLTNVVAIGTGDFHSLAVVEDGTVVAWGAGGLNSGPDWNGRQSIVPSNLRNVVAVGGGQLHSLALRQDGTIVGWGANDAGQTNVPSSVTDAVAISCGAGHNIALRRDGRIVMWGLGAFGQTNMPSGLTNVVDVDATDNYSSAVMGEGSPVIKIQPVSRTVPTGRTAVFLVMAAGSPPVNYQWRVDGTSLSGETSSMLVLTNVQPAYAGTYTVTLSNSRGTTVSSSVSLRVVEGSPFITLELFNQAVVLGSNATFAVAANGTPPINYQWQFRGTNLANQTNLTLNLTNVQPANGGGYRVILSNPVGNSTSSTAILNILLPSVTVAIQGQGVVTVAPDKPFYNVGEQVTLAASPARWYAFTRWGDGPTVNPRIINIAATNSYAVVFSPTTAVETLTFSSVSRIAPVGMPALFVDGQFMVTGAVTRLDDAQLSMLTTFSNGSIFYTLDGSAPSFGASLYSGPFDVRRSVTVRAIAYDANFLNAWEVDPLHLNIEPTFVVRATTSGGGTMGVAPSGASYRSNTLVMLSAIPAQGWTFLQWLGDASGTSATTSVRVLNRDLCVQGLFGTVLGISVAGNGSVMTEPVAPMLPYGTEVRLTALPQPGNYFGAWGNAAASTINPLLFLVTNANPTVSCVFGSLSAGQVSLTVLVNGRGRVNTNPRGNRFPLGQSVVLTATADANQEFLGWSGDASGTSTNLTLSLVQSKLIAANFTKRPLLSLGPCLGGWRENQFQLTLRGEFGGHYRIEQSSGLTNWSSLGTLTNIYGLWQVTDLAATNSATQFYRALEDP